MSHDVSECVDRRCQLCEAYVQGSDDACGELLRARDHGLPSWVVRCDTSCDHPRCILLWTMDFAHRAVAAKVHTDGAEAWAAANPELSAQLRDVLDEDEGE